MEKIRTYKTKKKKDGVYVLLQQKRSREIQWLNAGKIESI